MALSEYDSDVDMTVEPDEPDVDDDDNAEDSEELSPPPSPASKPRLKIKLKLPQVPSSNEPSSRATSIPSGEGPSQLPSRRGVSKDDVESEDGDEEDDDGAIGSSARPMTSRQAVLASVVDSSHVSLSESSRKKKQLTEEEIALRREETARKRRNLSEKKLEDEKMETINRLLKKQSKSKTKRNVLSTADDRTPVSVTPAVVSSTRDGSQPPLEAEMPEPVEMVPTSYRWISTIKPPAVAVLSTTSACDDDVAMNGGGTEVKMRLTFSVPVCALPAEHVQAQVGQVRMPPATIPICDVSGCGHARKYRLVKDWMKGACGMDHLKDLERQMTTSSCGGG
ncbi:PAPA-1-like conserved region-domain-containing protein [Pisolithus albus]|nr:PAPA-1-like conserved region-domain-containing protein [Pisolithus albus]